MEDIVFRNIGANKEEIEIVRENEPYKILFLKSYNTIVGAYVPSEGWMRANDYHNKTTSPTTERHINEWLASFCRDTDHDREITTEELKDIFLMECA